MVESLKFPDRFEIVRSGADGDFKSKLVVLRPFQAKEVMAKIEGCYEAFKRWSSVQISADKHIELNSELVFMNHSCDPSVIIDVETLEVIAARDLQPGDEATFFYPSTEWDMSQPFDCWCGAPQCIKRVSGAKNLPAEALKCQFINKHIRSLLDRQA
ncbi:uncharacterized protein SPPG_04074 [Spizellomyces punctatus DAOM BR117]|uniref:SET domain-containing protein n=1 Tax=Spizellomyces punctatus (strain DAOM BR117) TaxID=645134 RepID=A0A0L0HHM7_SPIPD|nr:uncharacterized protein SPPG_04074 [Spizellomyces punctatus DAOM BR117]KND00976.1 hypothetical protein SPPG_04074 [Spizellomyces punctatus DAOM BR117]|eukprot:XP_016609015.1 hypothetical protein SPPG_04074 [Spizellomyces punctatus DAOM BR117]